MKITIITLLAFSFSLTLYSFAKPNAKTFSLAIEVKNLRNEKGVVQFALYNKDGLHGMYGRYSICKKKHCIETHITQNSEAQP